MAAPISPTDMAEDYEHQGYVFPLPAPTRVEAAACRRELEEIERDCAGRPGLTKAARSHPHLVLPFVAEIVRRPEILTWVGRVLGPDLLVWAATLFIKEPGSPDHISWHQDLTYWGLDSDAEVTAWLALSSATADSGAMRFVPGSHRRPVQAKATPFSTSSRIHWLKAALPAPPPTTPSAWACGCWGSVATAARRRIWTSPIRPSPSTRCRPGPTPSSSRPRRRRRPTVSSPAAASTL